MTGKILFKYLFLLYFLIGTHFAICRLPTRNGASPEMETDMKTAFDPLLTPSGRYYWKSNNFSKLSDVALDAVIAAASTIAPPEDCITRLLFNAEVEFVPPFAIGKIPVR